MEVELDQSHSNSHTVSVCGLRDHSNSSPIKSSNHDVEMLQLHAQAIRGHEIELERGLDMNDGEKDCENENDLHNEAMEILYGSGGEEEDDFDDVQLLSELESLLKYEYDQCSLQCYLESMGNDDDYLIEQYEHDTGVDYCEYSTRQSVNHSHCHSQVPIEGTEGNDSDGELLCPCCQSHIMHPLVSTDMNMGIINSSSDQACDMLFCFNCSASLYIHTNIEHMMDLLSGIYEK